MSFYCSNCQNTGIMQAQIQITAPYNVHNVSGYHGQQQSAQLMTIPVPCSMCRQYLHQYHQAMELQMQRMQERLEALENPAEIPL